MAVRKGPITVDSKTVSSAGTPEDLTADTVRCTSVFIIEDPANSGANVYLVDSNSASKKIEVPASGLTLPVDNPALLRVDVDTDGDAVNWVAI